MASAVLGPKADASQKVRKKRWQKHRVFNRERGKCFWCKRQLVMDRQTWPLPFNMATLDHILTKAEGGKDSLDNMVLSCMPCNADRGAMPAHEYLALVKARSSLSIPARANSEANRT